MPESTTLCLVAAYSSRRAGSLRRASASPCWAMASSDPAPDDMDMDVRRGAIAVDTAEEEGALRSGTAG